MDKESMLTNKESMLTNKESMLTNNESMINSQIKELDEITTKKRFLEILNKVHPKGIKIKISENMFNDALFMKDKSNKEILISIGDKFKKFKYTSISKDDKYTLLFEVDESLLWFIANNIDIFKGYISSDIVFEYIELFTIKIPSVSNKIIIYGTVNNLREFKNIIGKYNDCNFKIYTNNKRIIKVDKYTKDNVYIESFTIPVNIFHNITSTKGNYSEIWFYKHVLTDDYNIIKQIYYNKPFPLN